MVYNVLKTRHTPRKKLSFKKHPQNEVGSFFQKNKTLLSLLECSVQGWDKSTGA
jgi:hypothetical protein